MNKGNTPNNMCTEMQSSAFQTIK